MRRVDSHEHRECSVGSGDKAIMTRVRGLAKITSDPGKRAQECGL